MVILHWRPTAGRPDDRGLGRLPVRHAALGQATAPTLPGVPGGGPEASGAASDPAASAVSAVRRVMTNALG